jgi:phosphoserine phosphatase
MPEYAFRNANTHIHFPEVSGSDIVFDMDGTILTGDLGETVFFLLHGKPFEEENLEIDWLGFDALSSSSSLSNPEKTLQQYLSFSSSGAFGEAYRLTVHALAKYPPENVRVFARQILENNTKVTTEKVKLTDPDQKVSEYTVHIGAKIRSEMALLVGQFIERGSRVWIVSASPQPVVEACGEALGIQRNRIFGATIDEGEGKISRFPWKEEKVATLQDAGVFKPLMVFGNGIEDLNMLEIAVKPVVVADAHEPLLLLANEREWDIFGENSTIEWE